jgi:uncharacterized membrane protein YkvA (DUF1232 family)
MNSTSSARSQGLAQQLYTLWKGLRDPSIPWAAKWLIPLAAAIYWISPIDLIPFFPVDDIVVVLVAFNLFIQMMARYQQAGPTAQPGAQQRTSGAQHDHNRHQTIETTWRVIEE